MFFPEGAMTETNAEYESLQDFQLISKHIAANGGCFDVHCDFAQEYTGAHIRDTIMNASLLQFPFRCGGLHENRMTGTGSFTSNVDIEEYSKLLARLSQKHFHHKLFSLVLYNIGMKQKILRATFFGARDKKTVHALATEITPNDLESAITNRQKINSDYNNQ